MERRDSNNNNNKEGDLSWRLSSRNPLLPPPSSSSSSSAPPNHRRENLSSSVEYHSAVINPAVSPSIQNRSFFRLPENRRETLSSIPEYHPENHNFRNNMAGNPVSSFPDYLYPSDYLSPENQVANFILPEDVIGYGPNMNPYHHHHHHHPQYHHHQNSNPGFLEFPDDHVALQDAMKALAITNSPYPSAPPSVPVNNLNPNLFLTTSNGPSFRHQSAMEFEMMRRIEAAAENRHSYTAAAAPPPTPLYHTSAIPTYSEFLQYQNNCQTLLANLIPPTSHRALTAKSFIPNTTSNNNNNNNGSIHHHQNRTNPIMNNNGFNIQARERRSYSSLEEIRGRMANVAMEKEGCSFLQRKIMEARRDEFEAIFSEILESICDVMVDQFGHHLMQDLYGKCNEEEITRVVLAVSSEDKMMDICLDVHGTRAIQKLLEYLNTRDQIGIILSVLRPITIILTRSANGHHVIQNCLSSFSFEDTKYIVNEVANNSAELAMDKSGCCVLQTCVTNAKGELRERIIADITANAVIFSENLYGNYVVQYLLGINEPRVRARVIAQLEGRFVSLSMNKYGSNVVEKCIRDSSPDQSARIIKELITSPNFVTLLQDQYGNYVAQSALDISKGHLWNIMVTVIQSHYPSLHSHPYGKRVLAKTRGNKSQHNHHHR